MTSEKLPPYGQHWRAWMLSELTKFFGHQHAVSALDKISAAMSIGISQEYLLIMAGGGLYPNTTWDKYRAWLDYLQERWVRLICPIQDILMVSFPPEKAMDVVCLVEDLHYKLETILTAATQLGTWERFEPWLDETFSVAVEADMKANGVDPDAIAREVREAQAARDAGASGQA